MKKITSLLIILILIFMMTSSSYASGLRRLTGKINENNQKVITLMYHMVSEVPEYINTYCITPKALEEDILYLKENNYIFAFVNEIDVVCAANPNKNIAVLTFDDGYESDYNYVLPLLKKYNAKATFFVFSSMLNKPFYMTDNQLKELAASPYTEIGNHSYELHNKTPEEICKLYASYEKTEDIIKDFEKNKKILESITGKNITSLSYPNGIHTYYADNLLKKRKICNISITTNELKYSAPNYLNKPIGRYNRSDLRSVEDIVKKIMQN